MGGEGKIVPNNTHFDTTRANVEISGSKALDLPVPEGLDPSIKSDFKAAQLEMLRLAVPRRVYTQSHIDYVVECIGQVFQKKDKLKGMRIVYEPPVLRHFTFIFEPL
jgi:tryptophanase